METVGKFLVIAGGVLLLLGGLVWLLSKVPFLGHLPGDIRIERPGFTCLVPLASSIVLSILLTVLLNIVIQIVRFLIRRGP
ncbi:MAG: DUF2905 domain-containing protein [Chloroflexi bacterium]|nr:MAG: DUF2905 domain-containing protein [Chloroflexota bacterium]